MTNSSQLESEAEEAQADETLADEWVSKDGNIRWSKTPVAVPQGRRLAANVVHQARSVLLLSQNMSDPRLSMEYFFDQSFYEILLLHTNEDVNRRKMRDPDVHRYYQDKFDIQALRTCIGLMILTWVMRSMCVYGYDVVGQVRQAYAQSRNAAETLPAVFQLLSFWWQGHKEGKAVRRQACAYMFDDV